MSQYLKGNYYFLTDKGNVRKINEDYVRCTLNPYGNVLLVLADGMGGANKGEYASKTLVDYIIKSFLDLEEEFKKPKAVNKWLNKTVKEANKIIYEKSQKSPEYKGMGTTLSLALIIKSNLFIAQVGDSRVYRLYNDELEQLTVDQSYVNYLVHDKQISLEEASSHPDRHQLTNAIGTKKIVNVDIQNFEYKGEKLLLCSDGLYNNVTKKDLYSILKSNDSLDKKCLQLIAFGNANGGTDNMAVIIWESK